jgi:hypothetical protein
MQGHVGVLFDQQDCFSRLIYVLNDLENIAYYAGESPIEGSSKSSIGESVMSARPR